MIRENPLKIYVYAISKNEEKFVKRFCESAKEADGIIILDTGSVDQTVELAKKHGALVYEANIQPWRFDVARNISLYHVPNDADVCFCADLDDVLQPGWRKEIEKYWIKGKTTNMKYLYQYGKNLTFYYSKIHTKQNFLWKHMCHEYLFIDPRIKENPVTTTKLLLIHEPDVTKPRSNYLGLLEADLLDNPNNIRSMYYYGRELFYNKNYTEAIEEFNRYLNIVTDPTNLDRNFILRTKAECLKELNESEKALNIFRQATSENPNIRDSWVSLSQFCYNLKRWQECLYAASMGLEITHRTFHHTLRGDGWGYKLFDLAALAAYNLNIKSLSIMYGKKALEKEPNDIRLKNNLTYYENMNDSWTETNMFHTIQEIKNKGYFPDVIFDIGSFHGKWTQECLKIYPNSVYHLFDGNDHKEINELTEYKNVNIHRNIILNEISGQVCWYENKSTGDSFFKENTCFFKNKEPIEKECFSLDEYIEKNVLLSKTNNILIKIDTQGSELNILKGSTHILTKTDFIILEVPVFGQYNEGAPTFIDYINYMDGIGFVPYSIEDNIYSPAGKFNVQTNIVFIKKEHNFEKLVQNALMGITENNNKLSIVNTETTKKQVTVITYCSGYPYETFLRFADTLYLTGFSGNLIFIINEQDIPTIEKLTSIYPNVSYFVDTVDVTRQCQQKRYFIFKEILNNLKTDYVLLADSRDLFFQRNIEEYELPLDTEVVFAGEGQIIEKDALNLKWLSTIEKDLNESFITKIQHKNIVCSGTTYGTTEGIKKYVNHMCNLMTEKVSADYAGLDQGMHMYLLYSNTINDFKFKILPVTNVFFNTLIFGFKWMIDQDFVNDDKEISYIVHQWDRMPKYMKDRLNYKYRNRGYSFN